MPRRYLITGGTGFLGRSLVRALVARGEGVRVLDNDSRGNARWLSDVLPKIELLNGDIRDPATVTQACKGIDVVCHLAFINGTEFFYTKPELVLEVGVKGMLNVLDGCSTHQVHELMLVSSSEVYQKPLVIPTDETAPLSIPDPLNPRYSYAGGKIISELLAINYGRARFGKVTIVRPHNVYGPNMGKEHVIPQFIIRLNEARGKSAAECPVPLKIQGTGEEMRSFIFVEDFTRGVMDVLDRGEHLQIYHVGTTEERSIRQLAEEVASCMGIELLLQTGPLQPGSVARRCPSIAKVRALGFDPQMPFLDGLQQTVSWYLSHADQ